MEKNQLDKANNLAKRLIEARQRQGFATAKEFYQHLEVLFKLQNKDVPFSYPAYASYENGNRQPRLDILVILARTLETSIDVLLDFYDNDYLLHFLTTLGFSCLKAKDFIYIETENKDYITIRSEVLLHLIALADKDHKEYIRQRLQDFLASLIRQVSGAYLAEATNLIGKAMATLLNADYEKLCTDLLHCPRSLNIILENDPITALAFYYYTGIHPTEDIKRANELADYLMCCYDYDFSQSDEVDDLPHSLPDKYENAWHMLHDYTPPKTIDYIDEYMAQRLQIDSANFYDIRYTFLYTIGYHTPFSYLEEDDIPGFNKDEGDLFLVNKYTQNETPSGAATIVKQFPTPSSKAEDANTTPKKT